ncbi:MAG: hypothetical protein OEZ43_17680 [Gammaproteobacteria bacterium]|nr:hypothetical protein [Gammaproteobacteria bacterium]
MTLVGIRNAYLIGLIGFSLLNACGVANQAGGEAGIIIFPTETLYTSEQGGHVPISIKLKTSPNSEVHLQLSSSDTSEGVLDISELHFNASNWNVEQKVILSGVDDNDKDGNREYAVELHISSDDSRYANLNLESLPALNLDNDEANITIFSPVHFQVGETNNSSAIAVVLNARPTANVSFPVSIPEADEARTEITQLTFTVENWDKPQLVTIFGVNDFLVDGPQSFTVVFGAASSDDGDYNGLDAGDIIGTTLDDDVAEFAISVNSATTSESGGKASMGVRLRAQPLHDVSVTIASSNVNEIIVDKTTLTFTSSSWDTEQTVIASGVDDARDDGNQFVQIAFAMESSDTNFDNETSQLLTNIDDDQAGITISSTQTCVTGEDGQTALVDVELNAQPASQVALAISSLDTSEANASPETLLFTENNWNIKQQILISGVIDTTNDGDQPYQIHASVSNTTDSAFTTLSSNILCKNLALQSEGNINQFVDVGLEESKRGKTGPSALSYYRLNDLAQGNQYLFHIDNASAMVDAAIYSSSLPLEKTGHGSGSDILLIGVAVSDALYFTVGSKDTGSGGAVYDIYASDLGPLHASEGSADEEVLVPSNSDQYAGQVGIGSSYYRSPVDETSKSFAVELTQLSLNSQLHVYFRQAGEYLRATACLPATGEHTFLFCQVAPDDDGQIHIMISGEASPAGSDYLITVKANP